VWSDKHIKCMAPQEYKGRPWLQVKQVDVCTTHRKVTAHTSYNWDDDENDLMLGDQPETGSGHQLPIEDDEDIKQFIPVEVKKVKEESAIEETNLVDSVGTDGSGEDSEEVHSEEPLVDHSARGILDGVSSSEGSGETVSTESTPEEDDEGSGGGIFLPISKNVRKFGSTSESPSSESPSSENPLSGIDFPDSNENSYEDENNPIPIPGLDIFGGGKESTAAPAVEAEIVAKKHDVVDTGKHPDDDAVIDPNVAVRINDGEVGKTKIPEKEVATATAEDNKSTYILLAVLGIILLSLILFVACKRKGSNNRNRSEKSDVEKAKSTELQDMDKRNLGKALEKKNGIPEFVPLIDREKKDLNKPSNGTETYDKPRKLDEVDGVNESKPLLSSFKPIEEHDESTPHQPTNNDSNNNANSNGGIPNGSTTPTPAARSSLPGVHQTPNSLHIPDNNDDDVFMPASEMQPTPKRYSPIYSPRTPKSDRYSPVYSPETGRVKIKLTETPKPKTPLLVTRSRSRAGDYVTTPESDQL
jgi:hypothetical protein